MKKILIKLLLGRRDNYFDVVRIGDRKMILRIEEYISAEQMIRSSRKETTAGTVVTSESINGLSNIGIANEFYKLVEDKKIQDIKEIGWYIETIALNRKVIQKQEA